MTRKCFVVMMLVALFHSARSFSVPMPPMPPVDITGTIQKVAWFPEKFVKGLPGMSGSAGVDRTFPAHYKVTLTNTAVTAKNDDGDCPFKSGDTIELMLNHEKDDGFLKAGMRIQVINFRMRGDEGGLRTWFSKIQILDEKAEQRQDDANP